ncbi:OmpA family protein [Gemmobacter serpentinus]|uniref:OmpA family protein n=1 Tax=Gemmobacter serpentinus TaxID=2652247 RepID=UPI00124D55B3|nr:OmpA family protein [Gemmobacter serpentinus]
MRRLLIATTALSVALSSINPGLALAESNPGQVCPAMPDGKCGPDFSKPAKKPAKPAGEAAGKKPAKPAEGKPAKRKGEGKPAEGQGKPAKPAGEGAGKKPAKPADGAKPAKRNGAGKPAEGQAKPAKPAGEGKPAKPAKRNGEGKPAEGQAKPAKPAGEGKPAKPAKPAEGQAKPAKPAAKPQEAKPARPEGPSFALPEGQRASGQAEAPARKPRPLDPPAKDAQTALDDIFAQPAPKRGQDGKRAQEGQAAARDQQDAPRRKPAAALAEGKGDRARSSEDGKPSGARKRITRDDVRRSDQDFSALFAQRDQADRPGQAPSEPQAKKKKGGLSDLEKAGLVVLGALAVGALMKNGDRVVSNSGDRVVVDRGDGRYVVLKDDDTLLRQPGTDVETESFVDGSTRTTVYRADGSRVITVRDAAGRVLQRVAVDRAGRETLLIDDLAREVRPVDVTTLPRAVPRQVSVSSSDQDAALRAALARAQTEELGQSFTLQQIRDYPQVRALAPTIDVENIGFASGSAAIDPAEARKLSALGTFMADTIRANPAEMFLVEGHTDAVGDAAMNLALSDRRAESLALALTEYFGVPPENMVVQGYGEGELLIPTEAAEVQNRRTVVRMISPLLARD